MSDRYKNLGLVKPFFHSPLLVTRCKACDKEFWVFNKKVKINVFSVFNFSMLVYVAGSFYIVGCINNRRIYCKGCLSTAKVFGNTEKVCSRCAFIVRNRVPPPDPHK